MHTHTLDETPRHDSVLTRFMLGFDGVTLPHELTDYLQSGLAGVALYARNFQSVEHLRELTAAICRAAAGPVLIGMDQEGGTRFALKAPFTAWPSAAELGRLGDLSLVEKVAHAMALELRAAGCNLNFAPMLDLDTNPQSPVTKNRSFSADPLKVAALGAAFHRGLRAGGVLSCAKHFPGHGDTTVDPHLDLPVFTGSMKRLDAFELVPFSRAVAAGMPLVMTAHILLPAIDAERPASLSRTMLDVLRRRMGFAGVILADDLGMGAIARRYPAGIAALETFRAGADIAMLCHDWQSIAPAVAAVRRARTDGHLNDVEWNAALERIDRIRALSDTGPAQPSLEVIGCAEHSGLAADIRAALDARKP